MRRMKRALAYALSAAMVMGMSMTSMAADQEVSVDAPIYAYDVTNVIVPTNFLVAFNPNGLDVSTDGTDASVVQTQIVSKNYGIINKSTKDKVITVTLNVEDLNEGQITFAETAAEVTNAAADDYVVNLTVVPADASEVKVGAAPGDSADLDTTGADLADAKMTAATSAAQTLMAGDNDVDFLLEKAAYTGKVDLTAATGNNVADAFTINSLAAAGKGITAFTFGGTMNANADWTKLTKGIKITAVYSNENAPVGATAESGTGALFKNPNPVFKTGDEVGTIKYKKGTGNDALASITKIEMEWKNRMYEGYNTGTYWAAATDSNGMVTLASAYVKFCADEHPGEETRPATITYTTSGGDTKTTIVDVRVREPLNKAPKFTTGSAVGSINYEVGKGTEALASITKIEMEWKNKMYEGYNAGTYWGAATDSNGVVTLASAYVGFCADEHPGDITRPATITYTTSGGDTKTAIVDVKVR